MSLGRYGKAWQSPDITLLLMLDIFTSSQSGESNPLVVLKDFLGTDASKNDSRWGETKEIIAKSQIEPYCVSSYKKEEQQKTLGLISL